MGNMNGKKETYEEFVEKFKAKKTTDDCMTPANIYEVVAGYVQNRYGIARERMVRPFWPGEDYTKHEYTADCVVVDNPPFSIMKSILQWYTEREIPFFLFSPSLVLCAYDVADKVTCVCVGADITYENGAKISTSFVTNLEPGVAARSDPELYALLGKENGNNSKRKLNKYAYPKQVMTASNFNKMSQKGIAFAVPLDECIRKDVLDAMRENKQRVFGGGLIISERLAAERLAAERLATERCMEIQLSDVEKEQIKQLEEKKRNE